MFRSMLLVLCATAVFADDTVTFPMRACQRGSDDYSSCLRLSMQEAWPTVVQGLPDVGIPRLDPLFIEQDETKYSRGEVQGRINIKNVYAYGLEKTKFLSVRPEYADDYYRLQVDIEIPKIFVEGEYKAEGQLGSFKMGGKGWFNISMENIRTTWDIEGHVKDDRWVIEHFRAVPEVAEMKVWFNGLFDGNEELNKAAMNFVNEYWPVLYKQMLPYLQETWDKELTDYANRVFSRISFSKMFP